MGQPSNSVNRLQAMTLSRVLQTLREEDNIDVLLQTSLSYLQTKFNYRLIWIGLYDRFDHHLVGKGGITPDEERSFLKQRFSLTPGDLLEQVIIQLKPIHITNLQTETRAGEWCKLAQTYNIHSTLLYPLRHKDRCFGLVLLGSSSHDRYAQPQKTDEYLSIILGGLSTALYHIETEWQRQQLKHPSVSLFKLLSEFRYFARLDHYLEAIVKETHRFIQPTRTNIYWYHQDGRYFWRRTSNLKRTPEAVITRSTSGIHVQDLTDFYQVLVNDRVVSIGQSHSTLKAEVTEDLMKRMRVRSLLAAPIIFNQELLGFLAVESKHPRIWQKGEKNFVQGMAQLLAMIVPLAEMNDTIKEIRQNHALTAEITRAIVTEEDWQVLLSSTAERLGQYLKSEYFFLLEERPTNHQFDLLYQNPLPHHRLLTTPLAMLTPKLKQQLQHKGVITVEHWDSDSTLSAWHKPLHGIGVRSLLVCSMDKHPAFETGTSRSSLLVIGHTTPRTWTPAEQALVQVVAQQFGLILHQWHLNHQVQIHRQLNQMNAIGWRIVQETDKIDELERRLTEQIAINFSSRLLVLVTWIESKRAGEIVQRYEQQQLILPKTKRIIDVDHDPLIQQVLQTKGILCQEIDDLPLSTRQWLNCPGDCHQIWAIALRTHARHQPTGVLLLTHPYLEDKSPHIRLLLEGAVTQLAWMRRYLRVENRLSQEREELQWLNWYKQRRLEELYRVVGSRIQQLNEIKQFPFANVDEHKYQLTNLRYQQLLRQISQALASTSLLLKREQWHLHNRQDLVVVSNVLRRVHDRIHPLIKNRQLLLQVQQQRNLTLITDSLKLELVLSELLLIACYRSPSMGVIEINVQALEQQQLEFTIIDQGIINPQLIQDLEVGRSSDVLTPHSLDRPPGQHLLIVARIIEQMGGQFQLQHLSPGQIVSRLILPLNSPTP